MTSIDVVIEMVYRAAAGMARVFYSGGVRLGPAKVVAFASSVCGYIT